MLPLRLCHVLFRIVKASRAKACEHDGNSILISWIFPYPSSSNFVLFSDPTRFNKLYFILIDPSSPVHSVRIRTRNSNYQKWTNSRKESSRPYVQTRTDISDDLARRSHGKFKIKRKNGIGNNNFLWISYKYKPYDSRAHIRISNVLLRFPCYKIFHAFQGCSSPLVVKFADTQKEKDQKRMQQIQANLWNIAGVNMAPHYLTTVRISLIFHSEPFSSKSTIPFASGDEISFP